jgi:serine/threonine protein kinase
VSPQPIELARLRASDLERPHVRFTDGTWIYVTSGERLGHGGMGNVWTVTRAPIADPDAGEMIVAKTFREEYLILLREDETARHRFDHFERVLDELRQVSHPNVLPVLMCSPIADNYLFLSPLGGQSLLGKLAGPGISTRDRVKLLSEALRGLGALHDRGIVHRDFTLHNVLCTDTETVVFDFDLSVAPHLLPEEERTYRGYYQGRVAGSPEFSVAPELLDDVLAQEPITPRVDVYSIGTALYALFTDQSLYGEAPDLSELLYRIAEGMVHRRKSRVRYPDTVPVELRPIIETCLEREPRARFPDASAVRRELERAAEALSSAVQTFGRLRTSPGYIFTEFTIDRDAVFESRADPTVTRDEITRMEAVLSRHGYLLEKSLGRVKGHPIFLALPDPQLVATGRFPEDNTYRKIVTSIDVSSRPDGAAFVETWLARIQPIVHRVRQGFLTSLYKVVHEKAGGRLLLFSEYVDDPRFGTDLENIDLSLEEAFGLGLIVALSIARLHREGLGHNNVRPQALVFKGRRDAGRVQPLFVGLVEPSFDPEVLEEDVRNLSAMIVSWIRQPRIDALRPEVRPVVDLLRSRLRKTGSGELRTPAPTIQELVEVLNDGLAAIEPNYEIVRNNGGDVADYADLLVRHSLYNKLFAIDVSDK